MAAVIYTPAVDVLQRRRERSKENLIRSVVEKPECSSPSRPRRVRKDNRDYYYHDRNRSPPPRVRRRRRSFSPSPSPRYRDRRGGYSPPPRRSPPFYKRLRMDDYGGRRGHGPEPGDRRDEYDYKGGYERDTGGRLGHRDETFHGRFVGGSSGDWDTDLGGLADVQGTENNQREGLKSYKQFMQELEDDILPAEAERSYKEYKTGYIESQKRAFFDAHKDEEWLKDKYHPTNLISVTERRNLLAQRLAEDFVHDLQSGTLNLGPGVTPASANKSGQASEPKSDEEADGGGKRRRHGRGPSKDTGLLSAAPKAQQVSSESRRVQVDTDQALALLRKLDFEKGIKGNILTRSDNDRGSRDKSPGDTSAPVIIIGGLTSVKGLEGAELLDTLLTYLWRIHGVDYYGMAETNEAKGLRHVRMEGKDSNATTNGVEWEKKLDAHWQERLKGQDPLELMAAKEKIDAVAVEGLGPYVRKIKDDKYGWKYGCGAKGCTKLFHGAEFVHKHLKFKHPDVVMERTSKVCEDLYFQNYMNDENAPGGAPVMQPSLPKEKALRHRGLAGRLKDDRVNHRDHDGRANGKSENPELRKLQSENDGANGDKHVEHTFGGLGIPVSPIPSEIALPPVLMPVPGAGLLGPFVPAPPQVAMQMLLEQGGPSLFYGGRNGLSRTVTNGRVPIIALPPTFRRDPRRLRSYHDLDEPEDEVTVIDYRSL